MIETATDDALLLHMHQGLSSPCDIEEEEERAEAIKKQAQNSNKDNQEAAGNANINNAAELAINNQGQVESNGVYYDVRVKTHYFGTERQVVFIFTNVSAEKDL